MTAQEVVLYFTLKYKGSWKEIFDAIKSREKIPENYDFEEMKKSIKSKYVTLLDPDYPNFLKQMIKPPFALFYYGDLNLINDNNLNLSVIGKRDNTLYGRQVCNELINDLSGKNINIISGFAHGIDSIAHKASLKNGIKTVAVLASGIDNCYPKENYNLYEDIKNKGLIISEYPNDTQVSHDNFAFRNRLIAVFSKCLLVIEGEQSSGTSMTVRYALENSRDVLCVPSNINSCSLCNDLIKDGADLIRNVDDILYYYKN